MGRLSIHLEGPDLAVPTRGDEAGASAGPAPGLDREWMLPTGTGGYAASTVVGANTRGDHGLLVANVPGVGRAVMLAKLEETVHPPRQNGSAEAGARADAAPRAEGGGQPDPGAPLSTNLYPGAVHPRGFANLTAFDHRPGSVTFTYRVGWCTIQKTVFCRHGHDTTGVIYETDRPVRLDVRPMLACRPGDERVEARGRDGLSFGRTADVVSCQPRPDLPVLHLAHNAADVDETGFAYEDVSYPATSDDGTPDREDLLSPCGLWFDLSPDRPAYLAATVESIEGLPDVAAWRRSAVNRADGVVRPAKDLDDDLAWLLSAGDAFVVPSGRDGVRIKAGYPGRGERGRDTLVSLSGLLLVPGRFDAAESVLTAYAGRLRSGLVPNRLPNGNGDPVCDAMDAGLWYVHAVGEYWRYTRDAATVERVLLPACREIVEGLVAGTDFGIKVDTDGLLKGGAAGAALTWMDAAADGRPVTPRGGKPVEVQALWYNALRTLDWLTTSLVGRGRTRYAGQADVVRASFLSQFWNYRSSCVYDLVEPGRVDGRIRPNQILAASLPFTMLNPQQIRGVVDAVRKNLLTPMGLRTLAAGEEAYKGCSAGSRPGHQGAVWPWLMGPFLTATMRAYGHETDAVETCRGMVTPLLEHLRGSGCVGQISEAFDGDAPHAPRGSLARAVSVAELLRALWEDLLDRRGEPMTGNPAPTRRQRSSRRSRRR